MGSLRTFHLLFILLAIVGADFFGVWGIWHYIQSGQTANLILGVVSLLGGLGLVVYAIRLVRMLDRTKAH